MFSVLRLDKGEDEMSEGLTFDCAFGPVSAVVRLFGAFQMPSSACGTRWEDALRAGVCIESVLCTVSVVSPPWSRWRFPIGTMVIRWFSTSSDMGKSGQEKGKGRFFLVARRYAWTAKNPQESERVI